MPLTPLAIESIIKRLNRSSNRLLRSCDYRDHKECTEFQKKHDMKGWEIFYLPEKYYYNQVLEKIMPDDVVFDVGAGDLRFDLILSNRCKKVYAVEINPTILYRALRIIGYDLPRNLMPICGNAFDWPELPHDVTIIVCLMKHRQTVFPGAWMGTPSIYADDEGLVFYGRK